MSYIGPFTKELIDSGIKEFRKKENRERINKYVIDPILYEVMKKVGKYFFAFIFVQLVIICLLIYLISIHK